MRWIDTGLVVTTVWNYYLDPFEPDRHYIAYTDIGFARSTDAGKTWYWQTGKPLRNTTYELAFDPETPGLIWGAFADLHDIPNNNVISGRHYFARASGGVGVSTDFGVTWKDSSRGLPAKPITSVIVDPRSPKGNRTLYASAFEDGVYKSTDGGKSWGKASERPGGPGREHARLPADPALPTGRSFASSPPSGRTAGTWRRGRGFTGRPTGAATGSGSTARIPCSGPRISTSTRATAG